MVTQPSIPYLIVRWPLWPKILGPWSYPANRRSRVRIRETGRYTDIFFRSFLGALLNLNYRSSEKKRECVGRTFQNELGQKYAGKNFRKTGKKKEKSKGRRKKRKKGGIVGGTAHRASGCTSHVLEEFCMKGGGLILKKNEPGKCPRLKLAPGFTLLFPISNKPNMLS